MQDATKSKLCSGCVGGTTVLTLTERMKIVTDKTWSADLDAVAGRRWSFSQQLLTETAFVTLHITPATHTIFFTDFR